MNRYASQRALEFYAQTYDSVVPDWPGEIDFYSGLAAETRAKGQKILEIACGTGRVAIRLAREGAQVVGLDLSEPMLEVARGKSAGMENIRWAHGDMRSFDLGETFGLVLIPGHSFQHLNSAEDQAACLGAIRRHLSPGGRLVLHLDHQSVEWLGDLMRSKNGVFEPAGEFVHPQTGRLIRALQAWTYAPATQTAVSEKVWEEIGPDGQVTDRLEKEPVRLHCIFRFEVEHLLARSGFAVEALYGDFSRSPLQDDSSDMIWAAVCV